MLVLGLGQASVAGTGAGALVEHLVAGEAPRPQWMDVRTRDGRGRAPWFPADAGGFETNPLPARKLRRLDDFSRMFVRVAAEAAPVRAAGESADGVSVGVVTVSHHGPLRTTFAVLDDMLEAGDDMVSPFRFSGSVGNAPAAAIQQVLRLRGPLLALSGQRGLLGEALWIARSWLDGGVVDRVLIAGGDEVHEVLLHGLLRSEELALDGVPRPLAPGRGGVVPAVGVGALLVGRGGAGERPRTTVSVVQLSSLEEYAAGGTWPVMLVAGGWSAEGEFFREAARLLGPRAFLPAAKLGTVDASEALMSVAAASCLLRGVLPSPLAVTGTEAADEVDVGRRFDCLCRDPGGRGYVVSFRLTTDD